MASERGRKYSCKTAAETLEWINAIVDFLRSYKHLMDAHVVNFYKDRLWETVDEEWMECLRTESVDNLLKIPSGIAQDYWPASLLEFVLTVKSLVLPREQEDLQMMFPELHITSLSAVLAQGMNLKKKHEVEILSAIVSSVAKNVGAQTVIDVGAGQGYLAQVLSFKYQLSVFALDASSHHGTVTSARSERIKKHYAAKMHRFQAENKHLHVPQTVTCQVLSTEALKELSSRLSQMDNVEWLDEIGQGLDKDFQRLEANMGKQLSCDTPRLGSSLVLAGLHACGDLSVTMLRTFMECEEIKAVVSIGCCYNLLSEEASKKTHTQCGFPMSNSVKATGLCLGKNARDLACQSAERWGLLSKETALQNFELHAFRAAFQMVLFKYHPEILHGSPSIGRQGKALRRQKQRRAIHDHLYAVESSDFPLATSLEYNIMKGSSSSMTSTTTITDGKRCSASALETSSDCCNRSEVKKCPDRFSLFKKFCESGLGRLGLTAGQEVDFYQLWIETEPFADFIGPFWSLRAALGPVVEMLLLLDRLLFLQEQCNLVEVVMLPIFNPALSPRNVAIIARKI